MFRAATWFTQFNFRDAGLILSDLYFGRSLFLVEMILLKVLYSCGGKMIAFDQVANQWSDETINAALHGFTQANFVQTGSVSFIIGNVKWSGSDKEIIVRYQASADMLAHSDTLSTKEKCHCEQTAYSDTFPSY